MLVMMMGTCWCCAWHAAKKRCTVSPLVTWWQLPGQRRDLLRLARDGLSPRAQVWREGVCFGESQHLSPFPHLPNLSLSPPTPSPLVFSHSSSSSIPLSHLFSHPLSGTPGMCCSLQCHVCECVCLSPTHTSAKPESEGWRSIMLSLCLRTVLRFSFFFFPEKHEGTKQH